MSNTNKPSTKGINMNPFKVKKTLQPDFFKDEDNLNPQIRMRLLDIADDFIKTLEVKWAKPIDIVVTGSIANYNWSEYSDVDVHVIYDFSKIYKKTNFVEDYFMAKKDAWNSSHENLTIKGFPVELSVENSNKPLQSTGVYSLEKNTWVKKPKEMDGSNVDTVGIRKYCESQMKKMDALFAKMDKETDRKKLETLADRLQTIIDEMHDKRKDGLKTKDKELSNGNIMWKVIKHTGYVGKAYEYLNKIYDKRNTINESIDKVIILSESQVKQIKKPIIINGKLYNYLGRYLPDFSKIVGVKLKKKDIRRIHTVFDKWYGYIIPEKEHTGNVYQDIAVREILNKQGFRDELRDVFREKPKQKKEKFPYYQINDEPFGNTRKADVPYHDPNDMYYNPAEHMEEFANMADISELNENRMYLNEARQLDQAVKIFQNANPNVNTNDLRNLLMSDPTSVSNDRGSFIGRYGMWIGNMYANGRIKPNDKQLLNKALNTFNINKSQIQMNINDISSFDELCDIVSNYDDSFKAERTKGKAEYDLEKVYEDDTWVVYIPHTWEANRKVGGDTRWCTAADNDGYYFKHYIDTHGGVYYVNINKKTGEKYQFHFESQQTHDRNNEPIDGLDSIGPTEGLKDFYYNTLGKKPDDFSAIKHKDRPINNEYFIRTYELNFNANLDFIYQYYLGNLHDQNTVDQLFKMNNGVPTLISNIYDYLTPYDTYLIASITGLPRFKNMGEEYETEDDYFDDFVEHYDECYAIIDYNGDEKSGWYSQIRVLSDNPNIFIAGTQSTGQCIIDINGVEKTEWYSKIEETSTCLCFYNDGKLVTVTDMELNKIQINGLHNVSKVFADGDYIVYKADTTSTVAKKDGTTIMQCKGQVYDVKLNKDRTLTIVVNVSEDDGYQVYKIIGDKWKQVLPDPCVTLMTKREFSYKMCGNYPPPTINEIFNTLNIMYVAWNDCIKGEIYFINDYGDLVARFNFAKLYMREANIIIENCKENNDTYGISVVNHVIDYLNDMKAKANA